jgi:hypothetical protein
MRKLIILMLTLALGGAVQLAPRAVAQTAPSVKDSHTTTLNAQRRNFSRGMTQQRAPMQRSVTQHRAPMQRSVTQHRAPMQRSVTQHRAPMQRSVTQHRAPMQRNVTRMKAPTRNFTRSTGFNRSTTNRAKVVGKTHTPRITQRSVGPHGKIGKGKIGPQGKTGFAKQNVGPKSKFGQAKIGVNKRPIGPQTKTGMTKQPIGKNKIGLTQRGPQNKIGLTRGPGKIAKTTPRGPKIGLQRGPGKVAVARRPIAVFRGPRRIFVNNRWRTFVPLVALGAIVVDAETLYADGYVPLAGPVCAGVTEDGCQLRWQAVPTEDGGSEYQCVQYCAQPTRVITEAPRPVPRETTGVGPANEPAAVAAAPEAPETGCELLIYSEENFQGMSTPAADDQPSLEQEGWKNEIASIEVKSGTWDFYTDENYGGEMMRLGVGTYGKLDARWNKRIGSFMCTSPAE